MQDKKNERILALLTENAKLTTGQIAKRTGIPTTTVHNRIKHLEKEGIITRYIPLLDYAKLGKGIGALIFIQAEGKSTDQEALLRKVTSLNHVISGKIVTGEFDLLIEVRVGSMDELNDLIVHHLRKTPGVDKTQTMMVLKEERIRG